MDERCIIYIFSGTGNSLRVASEYRKALNIPTDIVQINHDYSSHPSPDAYSLIGLGYPVHAFNAPEIIHTFSKTLKTAEKKNLFLFHTGGEGLPFNDASSVSIRKILKPYFTILSERHYVMPYNMIFRHSDRIVKHMVNYMKSLVYEHSLSIKTRREEECTAMPIRHIISLLFRIEWVYARTQGPFMKADSKCTGCGLCAKNCPMNNITMISGHPHFSDKCMLCVRCSFYCPANAISLGLLNGWKVNGAYEIEGILKDKSIPETIEINALPFLYRGYYRRAENRLKNISQNKEHII